MALALAYFEVFVGVIALLLAILYFKNKKDPRYPPGPPALPLVGNLLQLGSQPQQVFTKWAKEYGPIYSIKMGSDDMIVLNDHKIIKELFSEYSGSGRSQNPIFTAFSGGNYGVVNSEGIHWEVQRRFTLRKLRDFGFAKTALEGLILEEVNSVLRLFEKNLRKPIAGKNLFTGAVVNALWSIVTGERNEWDAPEPPKILTYAEDLVTAINKANSRGLVFAPNLRHIAPDFFGWTDWITSVTNVTNFAKAAMKKHAAKLNPDSPQDFIDHYLIEQKETKDPKSSFYKENGDKNLASTIVDLFVAGSETTSHTLSWAMLYFSQHKNVQKKLQKELDTVVGSGRQTSITDRPNMPYAEATIMEILRLSNILPNGVMHRMLEDTVFHGFFLPKGITVMSNLYKVLHDPEIWGDADAFRPERFLNEDGTKVIRHDAFVPFSSGKRQCLGESLARDTIFLFVTCILQKYNIDPDPACMKADLEPPSGFLHEPKPFKIVISRRQL